MDFSNEKTFQEYFELDQQLFMLQNAKFQKLGSATKEEIEKIFMEEDEINKGKIEELKAEIRNFRNELTQIWIEFYNDLIQVKTPPLWENGEDIPAEKMLFPNHRISDQNLFYAWVSAIQSNEKSKIEFLVYNIMLKQVQNVIYDFNVEEYDDNFLDYRNMCNKVMEKIEQLHIEDEWLQRRISHIHTITALQKKEKLVRFIEWYKGGLLEMDSHNRVSGVQDLRRFSLTRRRYAAEDGNLAEEIESAIYEAAADTEQREKLFERLKVTYNQIYDELWKGFGDVGVIKLLRTLKRNAESDFPVKSSAEQKKGYTDLFQMLLDHFSINPAQV